MASLPLKDLDINLYGRINETKEDPYALLRPFSVGLWMYYLLVIVVVAGFLWYWEGNFLFNFILSLNAMISGGSVLDYDKVSYKWSKLILGFVFAINSMIFLALYSSQLFAIISIKLNYTYASGITDAINKNYKICVYNTYYPYFNNNLSATQMKSLIFTYSLEDLATRYINYDCMLFVLSEYEAMTLSYSQGFCSDYIKIQTVMKMGVSMMVGYDPAINQFVKDFNSNLISKMDNGSSTIVFKTYDITIQKRSCTTTPDQIVSSGSLDFNSLQTIYILFLVIVFLAICLFYYEKYLETKYGNVDLVSLKYSINKLNDLSEVEDEYLQLMRIECYNYLNECFEMNREYLENMINDGQEIEYNMEDGGGGVGINGSGTGGGGEFNMHHTPEHNDDEVMDKDHPHLEYGNDKNKQFQSANA